MLERYKETDREIRQEGEDAVIYILFLYIFYLSVHTFPLFHFFIVMIFDNILIRLKEIGKVVGQQRYRRTIILPYSHIYHFFSIISEPFLFSNLSFLSYFYPNLTKAQRLRRKIDNKWKISLI